MTSVVQPSRAELTEDVHLVVSDDLVRSRLTVLFRGFLCLPHVAWLALWSIAAVFVQLAAWVAGVVTGHVPERLHAFLACYVRYRLQVTAYVTLAANPFPAFNDGAEYPVDVVIPPPEKLQRLSIAFRPLLLIPALLISALFMAPALALAVAGWFLSLARGRSSVLIRDPLLFLLSYTARADCYAGFLSGRYPRVPYEVESSTSPEGQMGTPKIIENIRAGEIGPLPVVLGLIVIALYFGSQTSWVFLNSRNLSNLVLQIAAIGSVAIGIVLVLLLGEIDLSVGSIAGLTSATLGVLIVYHNWSWWLAIIVMLALGAAIGAFQGAWLAFFGVPSFVVTLAGFLAWQGVQLRVLGSNGTVNVFEPHIDKIAGSFLPNYWGWILGAAVAAVYALANLLKQISRRRAGLRAQTPAVLLGWTVLVGALSLGTVAYLNDYAGVPTAGVVLLGLVFFFVWLTTHSKFGRYIYAVGGNAEAARRAGINVAAIRIWVFTLSGLMAATGGLIFTSRLTAASTQTGGGTFLLEAIAAAVIGGTSLFGGRGSIWSALLGALVIGSVSNGLDLMSQPPEIKYMVEGAILLVAVTVDAISRRGREAAGR